MKSAIKHLGLAVVALFIVVAGGEISEKYREWTLSPDDYMVINAVTIPNHETGDDPLIVYDRTVLKKFRAAWVARLYRIDETGSTQICDGSGLSEYDPTVSLDEVRLYAWYMGIPACETAPGRYVVKTTWRGPTGLVIHNTSNVFEILEAEVD